MKVGDICSRDVTTVTAFTKLTDAARLLCDGGAEAIVAIASSVSQPTAIGILTDRDILRALLDRSGELSGLNVVDILSRRPTVLDQDEEIQDAMAKLQARGIEYAPVVGPGGTLWGVISKRELYEYVFPRIARGSLPDANCVR